MIGKRGLAVAACAACIACTKASQSSVDVGPLNRWTIPDVVRVSVNTDVNSLNPAIARLYVENYVEEAIFSGLVKYDASGKIVPDLAAVVPSLANGGISPDGLTIVYHLRRDARWQDGAPVTSADVKFTYDLIMSPAVNSPSQSTYARIAAISAPDAHTVVLHLRAPYAPLLSQVFCNGEFGQILPRHILAASRDVNRDPFNAHPIGSGPYSVVRWDRGSDIVLAANAHYFGGAPHIREIDVEILSNESTELVTMEGHQLDVATQARPLQIASYKRIPGVRVVLAPSYVEQLLTFNVTRPPLDDVRVRHALAMAIDRRTLVTTAFAGTALAAETLIPPFSWAYDPENGSPRFDPNGARALLDDAGWRVGPDGVRMKDGRRLSLGLLHYDSPTPATLAVEIERAWRAVGVEALIRSAQRNVVIGTIEPTGNFDAAVGGTGYDADPDLSQYVETQFIGTHGFNYPRYSDGDVDRWSEAALHTYDRGARKRLYALIQRRLNRDVPYYPIAWEQFIYAINTDLRGFAPETINSDLWNVQYWRY